MKPSLKFLFILNFTFGNFVSAQVISPLARELEISYAASFILESTRENLESAARKHSDHLMGVFQSENFTKTFGVDYEKSEGIGAARISAKISSLKSKILSDGRTELSYHFRSKALFHHMAAKKMLNQGFFKVFLPYDLAIIYEKKCTDKDDPDPEYYWYYWDPYRKGCERLLSLPATNQVEVKVKETQYQNLEVSSRFDLLRGDNGNGKTFQIDLISGFDQDSAPRDDGWKIFKRLNAALEKKFGLTLIKKEGTPLSPLYVFSKKLKSGEEVVVRHLLVDSAIESRSKNFALFLKNSVFNADVIVYSGHSGLGDYLDIPKLEKEVGEFVFNPKKRQLFYFNSCSSYTYYLDHFRAEKTKARIDIMSHALAAYVDDDALDVQVLLEVINNFLAQSMLASTSRLSLHHYQCFASNQWFSP